MNHFVTSIGRSEEYKEGLVNALKSYDITIDKNTSIERMEKLLELQRKKANGRK